MSRTLMFFIVSLVGFPILIWRGVTHDRASKAAQQQAEITLKSHVADTYSRAIEQLGSKDDKGRKLEIRLGGIYALEQIAKANADYHPQIMEVLCAYIRIHAPIQEVETSLEIDIQTCLTVIGRRKTDFDESICNLQMVDISGAILFKADLQNSNFIGSKLNRARLMQAKLQHAYLIGTQLRKVNLQDANLQDANLQFANFTDADLGNVNLEGAFLMGADLTTTKNITREQLLSTALSWDGEILANDPALLEMAIILVKNTNLITLLPNYFKIIKTGEGCFDINID